MNPPDHDYWDIYWAAGGNTARGVKMAISNRMKKLEKTKEEDRENILKEVNGLVWNLYERLKENQRKIDAARKALGS